MTFVLELIFQDNCKPMKEMEKLQMKQLVSVELRRDGTNITKLNISTIN